MPALAGPLRLVPIAALVDKTVTLRVLRAAAERGRLKARHGNDGRWYSTRSWADVFLELLFYYAMLGTCSAALGPAHRQAR
jgi:hypothetical protein